MNEDLKTIKRSTTGKSIDPIEQMVREALDAAGIEYVEEEDERANGLDFYLVNVGVHIEVKQFHSPRIAAQMERADDVIAIQGRWAAEIFCGLIRNNDPKWASRGIATEDNRLKRAERQSVPPKETS